MADKIFQIDVIRDSLTAEWGATVCYVPSKEIKMLRTNGTLRKLMRYITDAMVAKEKESQLFPLPKIVEPNGAPQIVVPTVNRID